VVAADGTPTAVWALWDRPGGAVFSFVQASRRYPDGTWEDPVTLSRGTNGPMGVLAAPTPGGGVVVVWAGSTRRNGSYFAEVRSASRLPTGRWVFGRVAGINQGDPFPVQGALSGTGGVRVLWPAWQIRGNPAGVRAARRRPDGTWTQPRIVASDAARDMVAATGHDGTITTAYTSPSGAHIIRSAPGAGWSEILNPTALPRHVGQPHIAAGHNGDALVSFEDATKRAGTHARLWLIHIAKDGRASRPDIVAQATVPNRPKSLKAPISWSPTLALDRDGRGLIAWPRQIQRPLSQRVRALDARLVSPDGNLGPREQVAGFSQPPGYVFAYATALPNGVFELRWNQTTVTGSRLAQQASTRQP
jgi:hypothetical protein